MKYFVKNVTTPDTIHNDQVTGNDKLEWTSPYGNISQLVAESINLGYQSRYYGELDSVTIDPDTGNKILTREYLSLEGAQHMKSHLESFYSIPGCKILEVWIETIADDGTVTRLP